LANISLTFPLRLGSFCGNILPIYEKNGGYYFRPFVAQETTNKESPSHNTMFSIQCSPSVANQKEKGGIQRV